ncbi:MAG: helix-turn-helix domain-containing protein [Candidatus Omnitrophica bacterium]|nr:helix-turn-helix domain-containing protein [Candidatus Omnitrophota bacterium]
MKEKLLTTREVSQILGLTEQEVIDLANTNLLPSFKVAGEFLRFRREEIFKVKETIKNKYNLPDKKHRFPDAFREFLYFNDFYIISSLVIVVLLWAILKDLVL